MIRDRIRNIQDNIVRVCQKTGQNPSDIVLLGVTKYVQIVEIKEAIDCGLTHIGENFVQEAREKFLSLHERSSKVTKHMIGHLQSNKVKAALEIFDVIQSVDSFKIAQEINRRAQDVGKDADILIQVNASGEKQKFGVSKNETLSLIDQIHTHCPQINLLGLMTIGAFVEDPNIIARCFKSVRELWEKAAKMFEGQPRVRMQYLSMGMTNDYEIALEEGANMLRIGSAIFKK